MQTVHEDSGYFEFDNDQDVTNIEIELTEVTNLLDVPSQCALRKSPSDASIRSHVSRGSSQLWDGLSSPDEETLVAVDDAVSQHQSLQVLPDTNANEDRATTIGIGESHEVVTPERPLYQNDTSQASQKRQRRRLELDISDDFSPAVIDPNVSTSPEDSTTFFRSFSSPSPDFDSPIVVAHSDRHQNYFDKFKLASGVQWEIARLVSSHKVEYNDISINMLKQLAGKSNAVGAPMVEKLLFDSEGYTHKRQMYHEAFADELRVKSPWSELDKEEERLSNNPLSGLGSADPQDNWYGGKVSFAARLREKERPKGKRSYQTTPEYFLVLEPPDLGPSTRMTRRWGSCPFVRVRLPDAMIYQRSNQLIKFFSRPIIINGRVFRAFHAKESNVFLREIDQKYSEYRLVPDPSPTKLSLEKFLDWHNPMHVNKDQSLAKWCARMALGLSNSVPGIEFASEDIVEIDDIYSPAGLASINAGVKPASKDILTDGCGFTNQRTLVDAKQRYNWELVPSAIQFRCGGKKGLLLRHPDDNGNLDDPPKMWTRPSQKKISYPSDTSWDRAHLVLDILRPSHLKFPARLSTEIIVNLAENGVSYDVFERLMIDGLDAIATSLTRWSGPYAMQHLWAAVARQGSVIRSRMSREAAGSARALGLRVRDQEDDEDNDDEEAIDIPARSKAWWADEISGCPSTLEETVLRLLDAGFEPQSSHILAAKHKEVYKKALSSYIDKYRIEVPRSAEAWIIPDPYGVLEPGQIFLRPSEMITLSNGLKNDHLVGDALVTRHPCRLPSDIQKVRAVWRDELRGYFDVMIFSVKGERSLASMLGGGDYDGDTGHVIWDPDVVAAFHNADSKYADPPPGLDDAFEKDTITVAAFLEKHQRESPERMVAERQSYLLAALQNASLVGSYSNWHDTAVYKYGYDSDEAWRLAYMFCEVLDSSKTGKTVKQEILRKDRFTYDGPGPDWKASLLDKNDTSAPPPDQGSAPRRQGYLTKIKFIMDQLKTAAKGQYDDHMSRFERLVEDSHRDFKKQHSIETSHLYIDPVLEAPWINAMDRAQKLIKEDNQYRMQRELDAIRNHVEAVRDRHHELVRLGSKQRAGRKPMSPRKEGVTFTGKPIEQRQDILRELSLAFSQGPRDLEFLALSPEDVRRYKASYAYILETGRHEKYNTKRNSGFSRFPFDVAMRELGIIKAASIGPCNMVTSRFYSVFNVAAAIKTFRPADGAAYTH